MPQAQEVIESAVKNQPKLCQPRWGGCFRGCLIAVLVLALPFAWFNIPATLRISKETTYFLEPLTADGQIDYFKALELRNYPPEMKTDENGYRIFVRQFGDLRERESKSNPEDTEFYRLQKYEKLGLDPTIPPTLTLPEEPYKVYEDFYAANNENPDEAGVPVKYQETAIGKTCPWTLEDYPMFADWVNQIDEPLDAIAEAIRKPVFFFPYLQTHESAQSGQPMCLFWMLLPDVQLSRGIARIFSARATYRIGQGDIDGAIEDKLTLHRFGRLMSQKSRMVQHLVGLAIEGMAAAIPVGANPEHPLTVQQIQRIVEGLDALPPRPALEDAYEWERCIALSCLQAIARNQVALSYIASLDFYANPPNTDWYTVFLHSSNLNIAYRQVNEAFDAMLALPSDEFETKMNTIAQWTTSWDTIPKLLTANGRGMIAGDLLVAMLIPATRVLEEATQRSRCAENMQRLTLALLLYEKEHGALPDGDWREALKTVDGRQQTAANFRCPSCRDLAENETTYVMIGDVPDSVSSPNQILIAEVLQPQKFGEGDGRLPFEKATFWYRGIARPRELHPKDFDGLGSYHAGGCNFGFRNGAVRFIAKTIKPEELQKLLDGTAAELP